MAARVLELPLLHITTLSTESRQKRDGVIIMARYIVSPTSSGEETQLTFSSELHRHRKWPRLASAV